jgi:hypothetical protein
MYIKLGFLKKKSNLIVRSGSHLQSYLLEKWRKRVKNQGQLGQQVPKTPSQPIKSQMWWYTLVMPATWEV